MTALHLDLGTQVGPDHNFHVVPAVGESLFLITKGGLEAHCGPTECSSLGLVAPVMLTLVFTAPMALWPILPGIPPFLLAPCTPLTSACSLGSVTFPLVVAYLLPGYSASRLQCFILVSAYPPLF